MSMEGTRHQGDGRRFAVLIKIKAPAGVSVYYPLATTSAPSYPLPPPTTLAGALAYSYLRVKQFTEFVDEGFSPVVRVLDKILYATAGAEGWMPSRDTERIYQLIYQRKERWNNLELAYTVGVRGNMYYVNDELYLFYVLTDEKLAKHAHGIIRMGRKENLVSVEEVVIEELEKVAQPKDVRDFTTYFYFPEEVAVCADCDILEMPKLSKGNFKSGVVVPVMGRYCISRVFGAVRGKLKSNGAIVKISGLEIPLPEQVVKGVV
ncbi:MAG: type I-A CRISPR-associated protein Cas5a [Desulfurococcaceae archaeon]